MTSDEMVRSTGEQALTVLVLETQQLFTAAVAGLLGAEPLKASVIRTHTLPEAVAEVASQPVDIVICEAAIHPAGWPELLHTFHRRKPGLPIVLLAEPDDDAILGALIGGAAGVFSKAASAAELIEAVQGVAAGYTMVDASLLASMIFALPGNGSALGASTTFPHVTETEALILTLLSEGRSVAEIAEQARITQRSVRSQMAAAYRKLRLQRQRRGHPRQARLANPGRPVRVLWARHSNGS